MCSIISLYRSRQLKLFDYDVAVFVVVYIHEVEQQNVKTSVLKVFQDANINDK